MKDGHWQTECLLSNRAASRLIVVEIARRRRRSRRSRRSRSRRRRRRRGRD